MQGYYDANNKDSQRNALSHILLSSSPSFCFLPQAPGTPVFGNDKNDLSVGVALGRFLGFVWIVYLSD